MGEPAPQAGTHTLHTSLNFLIRCDGMEHRFGNRLGVYGRAFYFSRVEEPVDTAPFENVCA